MIRNRPLSVAEMDLKAKPERVLNKAITGIERIQIGPLSVVEMGPKQSQNKP